MVRSLAPVFVALAQLMLFASTAAAQFSTPTSVTFGNAAVGSSTLMPINPKNVGAATATIVDARSLGRTLRTFISRVRHSLSMYRRALSFLCL
jgi:hypothetical protein